MTPPPPPAPNPEPHGASMHHVYVVPRHDVQWNRPVFRAPALPPIPNIHSELPFTAQFRARHGRVA